MDKYMLIHIDDELDSQEVSALCFLCSDVVKRRHLEQIAVARELFWRLEERGLLANHLFLSELLHIIGRADLLKLLEKHGQSKETDANPTLSQYRVTLYRVYDDTTQETLDKMKFLLSNKLAKRQIDSCNTALDLFSKMEKKGLISDLNLDQLHDVLKVVDQQLAGIVQLYMQS